MLTPALVEKLNAQINLEFYSSNLYLQMSAWCEAHGLPGAARFLRLHADEEMGHMRRLFDYVNETGAMARMGAIEEPTTEFASVAEVFEATLEHERVVTAAINELAHTAFQDKDYSTFQFLQWYVSEQHEEEGLFSGIVDRIRIIGTEGRGLFHIDKELAHLADQTAAEAARGGN